MAPTRARLFTLNSSPKLEAVCRAGWRGERNRCAVRMTAKGSVTPWMACGSRPVERIPEPGAFPTVGIHPAAGLLRTAASVLNLPPPTAGWQIAMADQGGTGSSRNRSIRNRPSRNRIKPEPYQVGTGPDVTDDKMWLMQPHRSGGKRRASPNSARPTDSHSAGASSRLPGAARRWRSGGFTPHLGTGKTGYDSWLLRSILD
jgi:hypothetical protein